MKEILYIQFYYKALHNFIDIDISSMVQEQNTGYVANRSSLEPHKIFPSHFHTETAANFYFNRIIHL